MRRASSARAKKVMENGTGAEERLSLRRYPPDAREAAFLLGGIGTGNVSVGARGELRDWEIFNWPGKKTFLPFTFFALWAKLEDRDPVAKIIESRIRPPFSKSHGFLNGELAGLPRMRSSCLEGRYPFVTVEFDDGDVPAKVVMECFTPFVPLNSTDSGIPGAVIRYHLHNPTKKTLKASIVGSLANVVGFDGYDVFNNVKLKSKVRNQERSEKNLQGFFCTSDLPNTDFVFGSMSLATTNKNMTRRTEWLEGEWTDNAQDFWEDFRVDGRLEPVSSVASVGSELRNYYDFSFLELREKIGSVGGVETIAPGETKTFEFILTWHFPNRPKGWVEYDNDLKRYRDGGYEPIRNYYATVFEDAWEVSKYLVANLERLESQSRSFQDALFGSTLPDYVIDAIAANITSVRSNCCFRTEDGRFWGWEGVRDYVGCGQGNVNHVWNYAQTVAFLFPDLERSMRQTEFLVETDEQGAMPFRARKVLDGDRWKMLPAADGQLGSIIRVYREWKLSGDEDFLRELWPAVREALRFAMKTWDPDGDCVPEGKQHVTYDIEFYGPNPMTATIFLAALKAATEMAEYVGDKDSARKFRKAFFDGQSNADRLLWNGEYYVQRLKDIDQYRYQFGEGCLSDQLLGQFMAHVAGLGHILPAKHVRDAARAVFAHNYRSHLEGVESVQRTYALNDEAGLVLCSWPHAGRPRFAFAYCDEIWTGVEYQVASGLIYEGLVDEGLRIVRSVRDRYDGYKRNPWSEIEAGHHYVRAMASWGLLTALSGFSCDMVRGTVSFTPKMNADNFRCFWSTAKAWGTYEQHRELKTGKLDHKLHVLYGDPQQVKLVHPREDNEKSEDDGK